MELNALSPEQEQALPVPDQNLTLRPSGEDKSLPSAGQDLAVQIPEQDAERQPSAQDPASQTPEQQKLDLKYMKAALKQAEKALAIGEVPIGAVIVYEGKIIGRGYNRRNTDHTTLAHAEITAIRKACKKMGDWRLEGCTLYCTLEPCPMCAGALVQSRIDRVVIGAASPKSGCGGTLLNILQNEDFNHQAEITAGVMQEACTEILQRFFKALRVRNKTEKKARRAAETAMMAKKDAEAASNTL